MLPTLNLSSVNLLAVLAATAVLMLVGWIWYLPKVFGDAWSGLTGANLKPASRWLPVGVLGNFLSALVLAIIVNLAGAATVVDGLFIGILAWLGFIIPLEIGELIREKNPFNLFLIRVGNNLIGFGLAGAILVVWR
ncbi:MAG: DUF1761 domain-containing protein [Anaerolineales bacterium]|nr:DUF1761 domain-containing protein [Anaerolineales bacterium]